MPGAYTVRLTALDRTLERPLTVRVDPRVTASAADLQLQFDLSLDLYNRINAAHDEIVRMRRARGNAEPADAETALVRRHAQMLSVYGMLQAADVRPTSQLIEAAKR